MSESAIGVLAAIHLAFLVAIAWNSEMILKEMRTIRAALKSLERDRGFMGMTKEETERWFYSNYPKD
jgi:hypothetical protein